MREAVRPELMGPKLMGPKLMGPKLMGIINATPDSFAGTFDPIVLGRRMIEEGCDILDIGGESTRPGALPVDPAEEQRRILPVIAALRGATISVDTRNAPTAAAALDAGATIVNDVSGGTHDPAMLKLIAARGAGVVLMHMRGTPQTMAALTDYADVVEEVRQVLAERIGAARAAGIEPGRIVIDPGIGFAKTAAHNLDLLRGLPRLACGYPILVGVSRKRFVGQYGCGATNGATPGARLPGSIAAALFAWEQGAAILRVHDVAATAQAVAMWQALKG